MTGAYVLLCSGLRTPYLQRCLSDSFTDTEGRGGDILILEDRTVTPSLSLGDSWALQGRHYIGAVLLLSDSSRAASPLSLHGVVTAARVPTRWNLPGNVWLPRFARTLSSFSDVKIRNTYDALRLLHDAINIL